MTSTAKELNTETVLRTRLGGAVVIVGVGNTFRGDDGAGPRLVEMLRERLYGAAEPAPSLSASPRLCVSHSDIYQSRPGVTEAQKISALSRIRSVHLLNCGETPENYIGSIAQLRPDTVVVVDCASLGLPAGETRIIEADGLLQHTTSTHRMSPVLFMNRLKEETGADVFMLAVQPAITAFGKALSPPVARALTKLADLIESVIRQK